jgi:hypothetical protein
MPLEEPEKPKNAFPAESRAMDGNARSVPTEPMSKDYWIEGLVPAVVN